MASKGKMAFINGSAEETVESVLEGLQKASTRLVDKSPEHNAVLAGIRLIQKMHLLGCKGISMEGPNKFTQATQAAIDKASASFSEENRRFIYNAVVAS